MQRHRHPAPWVFVLLLSSFAYFWHARDWNSASRLMLTYALGDRGTVRLDGLERHTNDIAVFEHHYYSDKLPGTALLGVPPYLAARGILGLPSHPLGVPADDFRHWPADFWVTLATSGLATAAAGALLAHLALGLGCGPRRAALVGLGYGLATPAYIYATLAYGHQIAAAALLGSFALIERGAKGRASVWRGTAAGALAAWAAVVELQVGPLAALMGAFLLGQVAARRWPISGPGAFAVGAAVPALGLLAYNQLAFGSPWDMGYFHERLDIFSSVHSAANPLGLRRPDWRVAGPLLWGRYRGLFFYAPILLLAPPGWAALAARRRFGVASVSLAACVVVFLVNLSYPNWDGGWCTGPRLLVPLLPFAMLPVAGLLAVGGRKVALLAAGLILAGGVLMLLFQGVGGRVPQDVADPPAAVLALWRGEPLPAWCFGVRFDRTLVAWLWPSAVKSLEPGLRWVEFLPLVAFQGIMFAAWWIVSGRRGGAHDEVGRVG